MSEHHVYPVKPHIGLSANVTKEYYASEYVASIDNPAVFWADKANTLLTWFRPWETTLNADLHTGVIEWFKGGKLNVSYNCLDRHLATRGDQVAFIFEDNEPNKHYTLTYKQLHEQVCKFANVLKSSGVEKGDRVCIYMPMIVEAAVAMLACTRIGAVHSVVFGGFSAEALKDRLINAQCKVIVTANEGRRGAKKSVLKPHVDEAVEGLDFIKHVIVVKETEREFNWQAPRDIWYHEAMSSASSVCEAEPMDAEDPLFILYTSGSTGKPKGVLHTTGGYLLYATYTFLNTFDYKDKEVFWCTADIGWITGHSYCVYAPLAAGATSLLFGGVPNYPNSSRLWEVVDTHKVNIFYTAPTAIRSLMSEGNAPLATTSRASLRILGTVGEPINPEAWEWYYQQVGQARCPIVDTWWQTETGGHLITAYPGAIDLKPGSATVPCFGVFPQLMDNDGNIIEGEGEGNLVISAPWPGMMRSIYGDHERFVLTYLSHFKGHYFTGDGAKRDKDGYYWITGRVDDVLNVSGHRLGTAEVESALVLHSSVAEAAVVGFPHDIKGQGIYAFVTLMQGVEASEVLKKELVKFVRHEMGAIVTVDKIQWAAGLPKTRSGKIMRRILRKIVVNEIDTLGDISTLAEPQVVDDLIANRV